jgi:hypothetical protein
MQKMDDRSSLNENGILRGLQGGASEVWYWCCAIPVILQG